MFADSVSMILWCSILYFMIMRSFKSTNSKAKSLEGCIFLSMDPALTFGCKIEINPWNESASICFFYIPAF